MRKAVEFTIHFSDLFVAYCQMIFNGERIKNCPWPRIFILA